MAFTRRARAGTLMCPVSRDAMRPVSRSRPRDGGALGGRESGRPQAAAARGRPLDMSACEGGNRNSHFAAHHTRRCPPRTWPTLHHAHSNAISLTFRGPNLAKTVGQRVTKHPQVYLPHPGRKANGATVVHSRFPLPAKALGRSTGTGIAQPHSSKSYGAKLQP